MRFTMSQEQRAFARAVAEYLAKECSPERLRDPALRLFDGLAAMGVPGMLAPDDAGGLGLRLADALPVFEEAGRAALPDPLVEHAAVAVPALAGAWQARAATDALVTVAFEVAPYAPDADRASLVLVQRGEALVAIEEPLLTMQPSVDPTRRLFTVEGDGPVIGDAAAVAAAISRGAVGTAATCLGVADRMIELAASYAGRREQFGKPVGEFQLVKGLLADAAVAVAFARPAVYRAALSIEVGDRDTARDVSMAKAFASEAAVGAARAALQVHGAIGYTEEHDLHRWLKRAWALAGSWGTASEHRARITSAVIG